MQLDLLRAHAKFRAAMGALRDGGHLRWDVGHSAIVAYASRLAVIVTPGALCTI